MTADTKPRNVVEPYRIARSQPHAVRFDAAFRYEEKAVALWRELRRERAAFDSRDAQARALRNANRRFYDRISTRDGEPTIAPLLAGKFHLPVRWRHAETSRQHPHLNEM